MNLLVVPSARKIIKPCIFRIALNVIRVIRVICAICGLNLLQSPQGAQRKMQNPVLIMRIGVLSSFLWENISLRRYSQNRNSESTDLIFRWYSDYLLDWSPIDEISNTLSGSIWFCQFLNNKTGMRIWLCRSPIFWKKKISVSPGPEVHTIAGCMGRCVSARECGRCYLPAPREKVYSASPQSGCHQ